MFLAWVKEIKTVGQANYNNDAPLVFSRVYFNYFTHCQIKISYKNSLRDWVYADFTVHHSEKTKFEVDVHIASTIKK